MGRICRDDLRYTDDVIATLQADLPVGIVADILNISTKDVPYHRDEVRGMSHHGTVLTLPVEDKSKAPKIAGKKKTVGAMINAMDPDWISERTYQQIADVLHVSANSVNQHCNRYKIVTASTQTQRQTFTDTISAQPLEWLAARSYRQISDELGIPYASVMDVCARRHIETLSRRAQAYGSRTKTVRVIPGKNYRTTARIMKQSAAWLAERTYQQIADELKVPYNNVCVACRRKNIITASTFKLVQFRKKAVK
jgi:NADH:ubiquinone oxidoreductase subunit E